MFLGKKDKIHSRGFLMSAFIFPRKQVIEKMQKTMSEQI